MKIRWSGWLGILSLFVAFSLASSTGDLLAVGAATIPAASDPHSAKDSLAVFSKIENSPSAQTEGQLVNPGFELGCDPDHQVGCDKTIPSDVYDAFGNYSHQVTAGEIFTPVGWRVFFKHGLPVPWNDSDQVGFAQPEVHVIDKRVPFLDPPRIHSGNWALKLFTFSKIHDAGLYQQVPVTPGSRWTLSAWVHAWTSDENDPYHSVGDPYQADQYVGIDPTGGTNPYASTVVWSAPAHIYDVYTQTNSVDVWANSNILTVFLRSRVKWPVKHNDMYWDSVTLERATFSHHMYLPFAANQPDVYEPIPRVFFPSISTGRAIDPPPALAGGAAFGVVFVNPAEPGMSLDEGRYQKAADLGIGWDRWPLYWYHIEPSSGQFNLSAYDGVVEADLSHGLQINAILMGTPGFYSTAEMNGPAAALGFREQRPFSVLSSASPPAGLYEPVFADGSDVPAPGKPINPGNPWANMVYRVVQHYRPGGVLAGQRNWPAGWGVRVWEIWNEPDLPLFWSGGVADYARLLKVAALAARQADPDAVIMIGGLADPPAPGYLADLLAQLAQDPNPTLRDSQGWYFDAVALHNYAWSWNTGERIRQAREILDDYQTMYPTLKDTPVWVNESGVAVWDDYPGPTWQSNGEANYMATMEEQAAFSIQSAVYAAFNGAATVFHFQLYDGCGNDPPDTDFPPDALYLCHQGQICASASAFGLWRNKTTDSCYRQHPQPDTARPAFDAFRTVVQTLTDAQPLWHQRPGGDQEWFAFYRSDTGQRIIVLWARNHYDTVAQVPAIASQATLIDQTGTSNPLYPSDGLYTLVLPAATNRNTPHPPDGSASIGGRPYLLIEDWSGPTN